MLVMQSADKRGNVHVLLGIEIEPGDIRVFPSDTWEKLGRPMGWLQEQIDEIRHGKAGQKKSTRTSKKKAKAKDEIKVVSADPMM